MGLNKSLTDYEIEKYKMMSETYPLDRQLIKRT
jgi:hypothetical protein